MAGVSLTGMPRHYSRRMGRRSSMGAVIQSFKKVLNFAPLSHTAATVQSAVLSNGTDSVAAGQTGVIDPAVPTGSVIKYIEIQFSVSSATSAIAFLHWSLQHVRANQSDISPLTVGGNSQRNQVHRQGLLTLGANQSINRTIKFRVPPRFGRVREGDRWIFNRSADLLWGDAIQVIFKFYR